MEKVLKKKICTGIAVIIIPVVCLYLLQRLLVPTYASDIKEGAMIQEYYNSEKNHDVLILGDCEVYENISPVTMWENYGISSYIRGMTESEAKSEAYNRMTIDGMKFSKYKIASIRESMTENESMADYIFPLLRYHSRWSELSSEDFRYMWKTPSVTTNGYLMQKGVRPVTTIPKAAPLANYTFSDRNMQYLDKIYELCRDNDISLVLMKAPSVYPHWYDEWDKQVSDYADKNGILYLNTIKEVESIGIDYTTDTFDYGQHLNVEGAEKLSLYLGEQLVDRFGLTDHRQDESYKSVWQAIVNKYYEEKQGE